MDIVAKGGNECLRLKNECSEIIKNQTADLEEGIHKNQLIVKEGSAKIYQNWDVPAFWVFPIVID